MNEKAVVNLIKALAAVAVLLVGTAIWYYAFGRKPSLTLSTRIGEKDGAPSARLLDRGEVLLLVGTNATLYEMATGKQRWTASIRSTAAAPASLAPIVPHTAATPVPAPAPTPEPADPKPDPLLVKRSERHFAKLAAWSAKLNEKRGKLKTPVQIQAFNEEAAKYHAELAEARAEAAPLHRAELANTAKLHAPIAESTRDLESTFASWNEKTEVVPADAIIWIIQGGRAIGLDRANGRITKEIPLAGTCDHVLRGPGCIYIVSRATDDTRQVACITAADGAAKAISTSLPPGLARYSYAAQGLPPNPNVQPTRAEFSAFGGELVQSDIRLIESKITERQVISGNSVSDMEEADKKTTGGWASDAAVISQAMAKDAAREATGGKERTDESTYEITLRRPFASAIAPAAPVRVQGRPDVLSTATLDLIVAGQSMVAFDHSNRKLWEAKLANPLSFTDGAWDSSYGDQSDALTATSSHPCVEDGERLYLFDKGFLSAFDRASGRPLWRLPSLGIRKVQLDGRGLLYVASANCAQGGFEFSAPADPVAMKLDAKSGKILWKLDKYEDCFVSGTDVYVTRETRNGDDVVNQVFDHKKAPETRFKLYKLSRLDGKPQWEWFQIRRPLAIAVENKRVSLLFRDEFQLIKSIAL